MDLRVVLQSFAHIWNGTEHNRRMTESDMYWQTNLAMGFGASEFSFYTYMTKPDFRYKDGGMGEVDGAAFINLDGSKTELYRYTKRIISEMKKFLSVSEKYGYESSHIVAESGKTYEDFDWTRYIVENEKCPLSVTVDKGVALITRRINGDDELYMFENIGNVRDELFEGVPPTRLSVALPEGAKKFYFRGEEISATPNSDGVYGFSLKTGDAVFVEITRSAV